VDGFVAWLEATALSRAVVGHGWIWPLCETIHFIGLSLVLGIAGFFDLRLMGFLKRVPLAAVRDLTPLAVVGFALNLATGLAFFIGMPHQYVRNVACWRGSTRSCSKRYWARRRETLATGTPRRSLPKSLAPSPWPRGWESSTLAGCCPFSGTLSEQCSSEFRVARFECSTV
jgi:hypothetical protein